MFNSVGVIRPTYVQTVERRFTEWAEDHGFLLNDGEELQEALMAYGEAVHISEQDWEILIGGLA